MVNKLRGKWRVGTSQIPVVVGGENDQWGYGRFATGGAGGATVYATTWQQLKDAMQSTAPLIVIYDGQVPYGAASLRYYSCQSNKTLIGAEGSFIDGWGFNWLNKTNIIIKNMKFKNMVLNTAGEKTDYIRFQGVTNAYVSNCTLESGVGGNDGLIDISDGSDYITVEKNWYKGYGDKGTMIGAGDGASSDTGKEHITFANNYYLDLNERGPLYNNGVGCHIINNFYEYVTNTTTANSIIEIRSGGIARMDNNYMKNVTAHPVQIIDSAGKGYPNIANFSSNVFENCGSLLLYGNTMNSTWAPDYPYLERLKPVGQVESFVKGIAGQIYTLAQLGF